MAMRAAAPSKRSFSTHLPYVIATKGVPVHLFAEPAEIEPEALLQLVMIAESGFAEFFVAGMRKPAPDVHLG
ncbi:hypothetical protein M885DRAFT_566657 [Pelagophyceae sp. CCMP2097]|nr:hypothetical protein M885DRAFT_566657 [Pelagophyceae sp. CCMP2097]